MTKFDVQIWRRKLFPVLHKSMLAELQTIVALLFIFVASNTSSANASISLWWTHKALISHQSYIPVIIPEIILVIILSLL